MKVLFFRCLLILCSGTLLFSCTDYDAEDEKHRAEERLQMEGAIHGKGVRLYKGVKLLIRDMPVDVNADTIVFEDMTYERDNIVGQQDGSSRVLERLLNDAVTEDLTEKMYAAYDYLALAAKVMTFETEIDSLNEDEYPTMVHSVSAFYHMMDETAPEPKDLEWNSAMEHVTLAGLLHGMEFLPRSVKVYEISMIEPAPMADDERKVLAYMLQGTLLESEGWHFLADEAYGNAIQLLEEKNIQVSDNGYGALFPENPAQGEAMLKQLRSLSYFLRYISRSRSEVEYKVEQGMDDLHQFITLSEEQHLDNEFSWFASAVYNLMEEDNEQAAIYLEKLQNSDAFNDEFKAVLSQAADYAAGRSEVDVIHNLTDTYFMVSLAASQIESSLASADWYSVVKESDAGEKVFSFPEWADEEYGMVQSVADLGNDLQTELNSLGSTISQWTDSLDLQSLPGQLDSLTKDGKELWNSLQGLFD